MPTVDQDPTLARDLRSKKTKSRNGCSRCKLKRLKCDETAPTCLQCKKRNVSCPGYEKTLKWSTKYEVLQPARPSSKPKPSNDVTINRMVIAPSPVAHDVSSGIEALAAVLPAGKPTTGAKEQECSSQDPLPAISLPALEETLMSQESSSTEDGESPTMVEPFSMDVLNVMDPTLLDDLGNTVPFPHDDFSFDPFESLDFETSSLHDLLLDPKDAPREAEPISSSSTSLCIFGGSSQSSNPRLSRSLLLDFYRLPIPTSPSSSPDDVKSILVQHYFKDVCAVFSSFDSALNPFRTTIGRIYQQSPSISFAIQSMAAAHLANTFPNMAPIGVELQQKACEALQQELTSVQRGQESATKTFLSIMLLGLTTSWHDSNALGLEYLSTARSLILPRLLNHSEDDSAQREAQFFEESLMHWEMLMGFVTDDATSFSAQPGVRPRVKSTTSGPTSRRPDGKIVPHPWTGVAPMLQFLLAEVGRLVRKERALNKDSLIDIRQRQENLLNASSLEEDLLAATYPSEDEIADTGDERTPKSNFIVIAEAYRCAGLLELYRVFPPLLRKRLSTEDSGKIDLLHVASIMPRYETPYEDADVKLWLNSLAMHILCSMESLPSSSGTFCVQPLLIVIAAAELTLVSSVDFFDVHVNDSKIISAREFVIRRLQEYALRLPNKPIRQMIQLVKETWRLSDEGHETFWIDVMNEKGWHTVM